MSTADRNQAHGADRAADTIGDTSMKKPDDPQPQRPASFGRRSFLFSAAGTSVAGVAAVTGLGKSDDAIAEASSEPQGQGEGYRVTGHIQRYYRSTRL